jgi:3-hydroxyacyl-[acyl-carrier-protein] dehydratase
MLLGELYNIVESSNDGQNIRAQVSFNADNKIFKGHFPELPVVPGVCQLQMLTEVLSYVLQREVELIKASHVKFLKLLNPTEHPRLFMDIKFTGTPGEKLLVQSNYSFGETVFFRFKGELQ